ncbi:MAG: YDG domain-containing protein [Flavobacterium sp.]
MKIKLLIFSLLFSVMSWGQTSVQNFGAGTGSHTSGTGSTAFIPNPTSGTTWARGGVTVPNAPINLVTASNPLGTTGAYVRAVSSTSTSVSKFSPAVGYTSGTEFYTSFKVLFGDASAGTTAASGIWSFYQGNGAMYSDANDFAGAQVFTGLRFTYGAGVVSILNRNGAAWNTTGLTTTSLNQGTVYTVEIFANNKATGTINYNYGVTVNTVAINTFDLFINGTLVGDDLPKAALPNNTAINSTTFIGISSTANVANVFVDDVKIYNAIPITYSVTYNGNTNDGGTVPVDASSPYNSGATVTVLGNVNSLTKTGYSFNGWNTLANGSGTSYVAGNTFNIAANTTLYAQWLSTACTPPSTQASAISTNIITTDGCNVNWTAGNGTGTMIVVRPTASANTLPSSGTPYTANLAWALAGQIDANNRVIFSAAGTTVGPITGLTPGTQYTVTAYEYNSATNCYNTASPVSTTFYTLSLEPTAHAASFTCNTVSSTQIDLTFSAANTITNGRAYIILQKIGSVPTGVPTDGAYHTPGTVFGDATVAGSTSLLGTDTTFSVTGLTPGTNYYFTLIPWDDYLSVPQAINYYTGGVIPSTNCTTTASAVVVTSSLTSSSVYGSAYSYTITASGSPTSYNAVGLPAGLTVDTNTGIISGTPTVGVGTYNIDISATNGTTDTKTLVLTITAKNLTITGLTADNKVYDRTLTATLSGTATLVGIVGSDDVTVSGTPLPTFATVIVGVAKPVTVSGYTLSGAQAANYTVSQPTGFTANITAKPLTVSGAVANNKVYNGTTVATITGATLVGVIAPDVVNITPSGTFATANAGTAIAVTSTSTISGADSSNYSLTQPTGLAADITQASQTITFNPLVNQYTGAANFNLTATASSGLTVTYVSSNPAVATVAGNTVTIVGVGTAIITASQTGNGNYAAAVDVNQNQVVTVPPCLNDSFTSVTFPPAGWLATSVTRSTTVGDYNTGPAAATFASNNGSLTTSMVTNPTQLRFYLGRSGNASAKTLTVEISTTSQTTGFAAIATYDHSNVPSASYNQYVVDLSAYTIYPNVWIRFVKTSATTSPWRFDDLEVFCATVWNGSAWSNGVPTLNTVGVINGNYNTTTNGNIDANSLFVNTGFTATITDGMYLNVQNNVTVTVGGTLDIQNNGSLVQVNDTGVNTGNIVMHRTTNVKLQDYVYWSSPVAGFAVANVSPSTPSNAIWKWNPTVVNSNGGQGYWESGLGNMNLGEGYIVRAPNGYSNSSTTPYTANFTGVPNNGVVTPAISRGSDLGAGSNGPNGVLRTTTDDNWNLLGNPYPSAIGIGAFLAANSEIDGFVRLWTHGTLPNAGTSNPYYGNFTSNYTASDYIAVNGAGATSGPGVLSVIGAGQGFFVLMNPGAATTSSVTFNNAMRNTAFSNSQFYKSSNLQNDSQNLDTDLEHHRIWMDLVSATGETTRTLVAYVEGATAGRDRLFDAFADYKNNQNFYSLISNDPMTIQGRSLPFDANDIVPMGIKVPTNGTYTIAIAAVDGLFKTTSQKIYIEDKLMNTINDITVAPYMFTTNQGIINDRFVLRYGDQALQTQDFSSIENGVAVYPSNNEIKIGSKEENIKGYVVYNVLGQVLATKDKLNANQSVVTSILKNNQALIVKVTLENGYVITRKIMF